MRGWSAELLRPGHVVPSNSLLLATLTGSMPHYQRLWIYVLLDGLAYLKGDERREWLADEDFEEVCRLAGVPPAAARALQPEEALRGLKILRSSTSLPKELLEELDIPDQEET